RRRVSPVTVLALDVIKFRKINDIHGYTIGDMRLKQLCHLLINQLPKEALLGRYVGDIFLVILPNMKIENALQLAKDVEMKAQSLISLSLHTSCLQHVSEESERQLIDRLFATLKKQKSLLTSI
ncbi:diguanylate cyclase, partial [Vibrio cholerae]